MQFVEHRIADRRVVRLIQKWLNAGVLEEGKRTRVEEGTPQGGSASPLLANIYLHYGFDLWVHAWRQKYASGDVIVVRCADDIVLDELDRELAQRGYRFVRYADDANIYVRSERAGHRVLASVVRFIERQLRLKVNQAKSAVARPEERHFVGFSLRRNPEDGLVEVFLSKRSKERIDAKIRELTPRAWGQSLRGCIATLNTYLRGWLNFFGTSCTDAVVRTLHNLDAHVRRRLRAALLRQWKRRRFIVRRLIRMGARASTAWRTVYEGRKSLWALSHCGPVDYALDKRYFADQGLFCLEHQYRDRHHVVAPAQLTLALE